MRTLPAALRSDEVEEHRQLCRMRLEHLVEVREPLVLISQVQRSGGTLLSQLFDGHPECHAHPGEIHIGHPRKYHWPPLDLARPETWFGVLFEKPAYEYLLHGYTKPSTRRLEHDVFPFLFLPSLQKAIFERCIGSRPVERERDVLDCYMTSYFNAWLDNHNLYTRPKKVVTGFAARLSADLANVERFFAAYPDGLLISIVREPCAWYASARTYRRRYEDLEEALDRWRRSTTAAIEASRRWSDSVVVLTYEQLVLETEATMRRLAERMGIAMLETLLQPTFNGRPIRANSSDPVDRYGIVPERTRAYRDTLDAETISRIEEQAGDLYGRAVDLELGRAAARRVGTRPPARRVAKKIARLLVSAPQRRPSEPRPEWPLGGLDETGEHEQLCRVRLTHLVEVSQPLVLVSQLERSGGTLLSRLFDGHPECHAHPHKLSTAYLEAPPSEPLDPASCDRAFALLKGRDTTPGVPGPFLFMPELQRAIFDRSFSTRVAGDRDIVDGYLTSYFNAWLDNHNLYTGPKKAVTASAPQFHTSRAAVERFFAAYPDGWLVSIVRDPHAWLEAVSAEGDTDADADEALGRWRRSVEATLDARDRLGERVVVLSYEELALETEATMSRLADHIGISMSAVLMAPTFNGRAIRTGLSGASGRVLDADTAARVDELVGGLYERAAGLVGRRSG